MVGRFVAAAEQGGFSRAAELLGKAPTGLTKAVGHLERELGALLFERSTRRIVLTEVERLYLDTARQVLPRPARLRLSPALSIGVNRPEHLGH